MTALADLRGASLYLDSNVLIYALEAPKAAGHVSATRLLEATEDRACVGATSLLTRSEVLVRPLRQHLVTLADRYRALLSGVGALSLYAVDAEVIELAAQLRADYPALKLPDALHVATAINTDCDFFISGDRRLQAVSARIHVCMLDQIEAH